MSHASMYASSGRHSEAARFGSVDQRPQALRQAALDAAAVHFTHREYQKLLEDLDSGLVDIRLYDGEGIVLMRGPAA